MTPAFHSTTLNAKQCTLKMGSCINIRPKYTVRTEAEFLSVRPGRTQLPWVANG